MKRDTSAAAPAATTTAEKTPLFCRCRKLFLQYPGAATTTIWGSISYDTYIDMIEAAVAQQNPVGAARYIFPHGRRKSQKVPVRRHFVRKCLMGEGRSDREWEKSTLRCSLGMAFWGDGAVSREIRLEARSEREVCTLAKKAECIDRTIFILRTKKGRCFVIRIAFCLSS